MKTFTLILLSILCELLVGCASLSLSKLNQEEDELLKLIEAQYPPVRACDYAQVILERVDGEVCYIHLNAYLKTDKVQESQLGKVMVDVCLGKFGGNIFPIPIKKTRYQANGKEIEMTEIHFFCHKELELDNSDFKKKLAHYFRTKI